MPLVKTADIHRAQQAMVNDLKRSGLTVEISGKDILFTNSSYQISTDKYSGVSRGIFSIKLFADRRFVDYEIVLDRLLFTSIIVFAPFVFVDVFLKGTVVLKLTIILMPWVVFIGNLVQTTWRIRRQLRLAMSS